jgi:serine protease Do
MMKMASFILFLLSAVLGLAVPMPESLGELKKLQAQVQDVVRTKTAATVSLVSTRNGSSGSGVIVSADGLILTAAHVIAGSTEMTVIFPDGRQAKATVLGANFTRDAAMARLVGEGPWPFAEIGDSDELKVGDFVVAMGHPKGYDPTRRPPVRFGRVMTKGELGFVTTDCTLIGGDSGGPLFDLQGRVVAIHSNIGPDRQINNHAGLAGFKRSWDQMLAGRSWGRLGGDLRDPDRPVMGMLLREVEGTLMVEEIPPGSPAAKSGIQLGDRVLSIGGVSINRLSQLAEAFADLLPGSEVTVRVRRDGRELEETVVLARLSDIYPNQRR